MSLDKAIEHGKERRQPYRRAKAIDTTCRNHGDCPWCKGTRTNKNREKKRVAEEFIREHEVLSQLFERGLSQCNVDSDITDFVNKNFWDLLEEEDGAL